MKDGDYKYIIIGILLILIIYVILNLCGCFKEKNIDGFQDSGIINQQMQTYYDSIAAAKKATEEAEEAEAARIKSFNGVCFDEPAKDGGLWSDGPKDGNWSGGNQHNNGCKEYSNNSGWCSEIGKTNYYNNGTANQHCCACGKLPEVMTPEIAKSLCGYGNRPIMRTSDINKPYTECVPVNGILLPDKKSLVKFKGSSVVATVNDENLKPIKIKLNDKNIKIIKHNDKYAYDCQKSAFPIEGEITNEYNLKKMKINVGFAVELRKNKDDTDFITLTRSDTAPDNISEYKYFKILCHSSISNVCCGLNTYKPDGSGGAWCYPHTLHYHKDKNGKDVGTQYHISEPRALTSRFLFKKAFPDRFILLRSTINGSNKEWYTYNIWRGVSEKIDNPFMGITHIYHHEDDGNNNVKNMKHKRVDIKSDTDYTHHFTILGKNNGDTKYTERILKSNNTTDITRNKTVKAVTIGETINGKTVNYKYDVVVVPDNVNNILTRTSGPFDKIEKTQCEFDTRLLPDLTGQIFNKTVIDCSPDLPGDNYNLHTNNKIVRFTMTDTDHDVYYNTNENKYFVKKSETTTTLDGTYPVTLLKTNVKEVKDIENHLVYISYNDTSKSLKLNKLHSRGSTIVSESFSNTLNLISCVSGSTTTRNGEPMGIIINKSGNDISNYKLLVSKENKIEYKFYNKSIISVFGLYEYESNEDIKLIAYSTPYYFRGDPRRSDKNFLIPQEKITAPYDKGYSTFYRNKYEYESETNPIKLLSRETLIGNKINNNIKKFLFKDAASSNSEGILQKYIEPEDKKVELATHKLYIFRRIDEEPFSLKKVNIGSTNNSREIILITHVDGNCEFDDELHHKNEMYEFIIKSIESNNSLNELVKHKNRIFAEYKTTDNILNEEGKRLDGEIRNFDNIKDEIKELLSVEHANTQKQNTDYHNTTIDKNFKSIYVENLKIIKENYNTQVRLIQIKVNYQNKIRYSFNVHQNGEYKNQLKYKLSNLKIKLKELEYKLEQEKKENYKNIYKTNQIIIHINNEIKIIKGLLSINGREGFEDSTSPLKSYIAYFDTIANVNKGIFDKYLEINEKYIKIQEKAVRFDSLVREVILLTILYYKEKLKQKQIVKNEQIVRNLIQDLNKTLQNHKKEKIILDVEIKDWNVFNENADLKMVEYKKGDYIIDNLEMDVLNLEEVIGDKNSEIIKSNNYRKVGEQLKLISKIKKEAVYRSVLDSTPFKEGFQSSPDNAARNNIFNNTVNSIQSQFNNEHLSVIPINEGDSQGDMNSYKIVVNNQCVTVYGDNKYCLDNCNKVSPSQYFKTQHIKNKNDALKYNKVEPINEEVKYPYYQMKSEINQNCLSINNEGVSLTPCNSNSIQQHWNTKRDEKLCLMD